MENRKRNIQMKFYVTEEEKRLIDEKMKQLPIKQYGAYFRKMAIDGYILVVDRSDTKAYIRELQRGFRNTVPPARLFASLRVGSAPFQSASATRAGVGAASVPACARASACMWRKLQNVTAKQMSAYTSVIDAFAEPKGGNAPVFEISE